MQSGLFGSALAKRGSAEFDQMEGYLEFIEYNVEAEGLGFRGAFCVKHHYRLRSVLRYMLSLPPGRAAARKRYSSAPP